MIFILDLGLGNCISLRNAFKRIGHSCVISDDLDHLLKATHIVLPGVGSFDAFIGNLKQNHRLEMTLINKILEDQTPTLGICLGMQVLMESSSEGKLDGLAIVPGHVKKLEASNKIRVPNIGWSSVSPFNSHYPGNCLFDKPEKYYFCHSFYVDIDEDICLGTSCHGLEFMAAFGFSNIVGVQFHPEKSHAQGLDFLRRFVSFSS